MTTKARRLQLQVEALECRALPASYNLLNVALHEIGHALGLQHCSSAGSIMGAEYNGAYDPSMLANDPAVIVDETDGYTSLLELYSLEAIANNTTPWKDNLDPSANNSVVDVTWSIMPDGAKIGGAINIIHVAFNEKFGGGWAGQLSSALGFWAAASQGRISFLSWGDLGKEFDYAGKSQFDQDSGDIRFGAYPIDGEGGELAKAYFPPPGGATAPGDIHFDAEETWIPGGGGSSGGGGDGMINPRPGDVSGGGGGGVSVGDGGGDSTTDDTSPSEPPPVVGPGTPSTDSGSTTSTPSAPTSRLTFTSSSSSSDLLIPLSPPTLRLGR